MASWLCISTTTHDCGTITHDWRDAAKWLHSEKGAKWWAYEVIDWCSSQGHASAEDLADWLLYSVAGWDAKDVAELLGKRRYTHDWNPTTWLDSQAKASGGGAAAGAPGASEGCKEAGKGKAEPEPEPELEESSEDEGAAGLRFANDEDTGKPEADEHNYLTEALTLPVSVFASTEQDEPPPPVAVLRGRHAEQHAAARATVPLAAAAAAAAAQGAAPPMLGTKRGAQSGNSNEHICTRPATEQKELEPNAVPISTTPEQWASQDDWENRLD